MVQNLKLGDLQLAILRVLWAAGEATVAEVHGKLHPERGLALTTIATMLRKLEEKGAVRHREHGRQFIYRAAVVADQVQSSMVGDLVERLFDGDPVQLVHHLLEEGEIDLSELDALRAAVAAARSREKRGGRS